MRLNASQILITVSAGPAVLSFATLLVLSLGVSNPLVLYIALLSAWPFILVALVYIAPTARYKISDGSLSVRVMAYVSVLAVIYFLAWVPAGLLAGQHPKDVVGSTLRVLSPFLVFLGTLLVFERIDPIRRVEVIAKVLRALIALSVVGALGKLFLVVSGNWDAWALGGYAVPTFVLVLLVSILTHRRLPKKKRIVALLLLSVVVLATILSLKRSAWIILAAAPVLVLIVVDLKTKVRMMFLVGVLFLGFFLSMSGTDTADLLIDRVNYTFQSGSDLSDFDNSTANRVHEVESALGTLGRRLFPMSLVVGLGPGAGYENLTGWPFKNFNELGEPYDIHNGYVLAMFRYGALGLIFHLMFFLVAFHSIASAVRAFRNSRRLQDPDFVLVSSIPLASSAYIMLAATSMIASSGVFGSWEVGLVLALGLSSLSHVKRFRL